MLSNPASTCMTASGNIHLNDFAHSRRLKLFDCCLGSERTRDVLTLDSVLPQIGLPCFIKVDVDGEEEKVLHGAERLNQERGVRWLVETHSPYLENACQTVLRRAGFKTVIIPNAWWRALVPELRPSEHNRWLAAWNDDTA